MTDQLTALRELAKKVEAGEWVSSGDADDTWIAIFDAGLRQHYAWIYGAWHGSLDAAKALHEAVLPGWDWDVCSWAGADIHPGEDQLADWVPGDNYDNPARSWLLAILRALIAMEEAK